jgi:hypothetical protein
MGNLSIDSKIGHQQYLILMVSTVYKGISWGTTEHDTPLVQGFTIKTGNIQ